MFGTEEFRRESSKFFEAGTIRDFLLFRHKQLQMHQ